MSSGISRSPSKDSSHTPLEVLLSVEETNKDIRSEKSAEQVRTEPKVVLDGAKKPEYVPKVFHGHMSSIQIASPSTGQAQQVNAFVVSEAGSSGSTEQLQICESEDFAKIQAIKNEIISETTSEPIKHNHLTIF
ncbi:hypothetical protein AB6A40_010522 [Gnathostoma spinigerum]|uniref:Uncharacterized protein n=1 Tax=Gnathostoma spinigerum TaxID=75299 RepID=A0ABD6EV38_9BILA